MKTLAFLAKPFSFLSSTASHRDGGDVSFCHGPSGRQRREIHFASRVLSLKRMTGSTLGLFLRGLSPLLRWLGLSIALIASWIFAASNRRAKSAKNDVAPRADTSQQPKPPLYLKFR
jgi:hypothetical protein